MIFKKTTVLAIFFVGIFGLGVLFYAVPIRKTDRTLYRQIVQDTKALRSSTALERHPSSQLKLDAQKDIYLIKEGKRSHFQITADTAELFLKQNKEKVEATEELEKVICMSSVGELYAEKGSYNYPDYNLQAEEVECIHALGTLKANSASLKTLSEKKETLHLVGDVFLCTSGEDPPLSIQSKEAFVQAEEGKTFSSMDEQVIEFLENVQIRLGQNTTASGDFAIYKKGTLTLLPKKPNSLCSLTRDKNHISAKKIDFDLSSETVLCDEAKGSLHPEGESSIFFSGESLIWQKKKNTICLEKNVQIEQTKGTSIQAEKALVLLDEQKPTEIIFQKNVQLFSPNIQEKETFALADTIEMNLIGQTLLLKADAPKRALFWQQGVHLSAPEMLIFKDPETDKECIQGKGDVRFTFNTDEQNLIERFMSKYL